MRKVVLVAALLAVLPSGASALELKNIRPAYGPVGAARHDLKFLPGDVLVITYDVEGLSLDPKTGRASFITTIELFDPQQKSHFKKETPAELLPQLGGNRLPGFVRVELDVKQAPGKYTVRFGVTDRIAKESKAFDYPFEVIPESFGFVFVNAPPLGIVGGWHVTDFTLVNMGLDDKKLPNVEVTLRVLDEQGKPVGRPSYVSLPKDLPDSADLQKYNMAPLQYPLHLNRPGRFQIDIQADDKKGGKKVQLTYPVTVLDVATAGN